MVFLRSYNKGFPELRLRILLNAFEGYCQYSSPLLHEEVKACSFLQGLYDHKGYLTVFWHEMYGLRKKHFLLFRNTIETLWELFGEPRQNIKHVVCLQFSEEFIDLIYLLDKEPEITGELTDV